MKFTVFLNRSLIQTEDIFGPPLGYALAET